MSLTAIVWFLLFAFCLFRSFSNASWSIVLYLQTFYALPQFWSWGKNSPLAGPRWNLIAGIVVLITTIIHAKPAIGPRLGSFGRNVKLFTILTCFNMMFVTFVVAKDLSLSSAEMFLQLKLLLFLLLIVTAVQSSKDFERVLFSIVLGAIFIGVQVKFWGAGKMEHGRLERVGVPGAYSSNQLASVIVSVIPIIGAMVLTWTGIKRVICFLGAPFVVNIAILCGSRGAFLGMIASALIALLLSRGRERKLVMIGGALGLVGLMILLGDARILDRFTTTFADESTRDTSAASRLVFWQAALRCIADHPLGVGGGYYKVTLSYEYLEGYSNIARAVHNGYINEAVQWGVQGVLFRLGIYYYGLRCMRLGQSIYLKIGDHKRSFLGVAMICSVFAFFVTSMFSDNFEGEWGLHLCALGLCYLRNAQFDEANLAQSQAHEFVPALTDGLPYYGGYELQQPALLRTFPQRSRL